MALARRAGRRGWVDGAAERRPVAAVADHDDIGCARSTSTWTTRSRCHLFDPGHSLDERIVREQFRTWSSRAQ
jgi:hypothetical protein